MPKRSHGQADDTDTVESSADLMESLAETHSETQSDAPPVAPQPSAAVATLHPDLRPIEHPADEYEHHPIADSWPMRTGAASKELAEAAEALADSLARIGQRDPIVIYEGRILMGRNRYVIGRGLGLVLRYAEYTGSDPVGYTIDENVTKRRDSPSTLAIVACRLATLRQGERAYPGALTQSQAAGRMGASERMVQRAAALIASARRELVDAVTSGLLTLSTAHDEVMAESHDDQLRVLAIMTDITRPAKRRTAQAALAEVRGIDPAAEESDDDAPEQVVPVEPISRDARLSISALPKSVRREIEDAAEHFARRAYQTYPITADDLGLLLRQEVERLSE